ncbi:hypothetical protein KSP39_PZI009024 [Platanthera zijinensis]|uniref:NAB domain-containing protein n=1 Tax=Platanthera zijinensis TaxID=2320716 RepID=A0AAP0BNF1_9ASPA
MEVTSNTEPKCSYSWWWDSHITPKNSKWLLDNLTNMDSKIKAMINLIEEDADSFARRAEMYYKKRPDLMKLVEEFYRAYRALAERYDYVTGALRQAHRTITMAFPDQIQTMLPDEPPSGLLDAGDEHTYESGMQTESNPIQWDAESFDKIALFISKEGLKSLNCLFADEDIQKTFGNKLIDKSLNLKEIDSKKLEEEVSELSKENTNLKNEIMSESLRADNAVAELQCLNNDVSKLRSEMESAFLRYKLSEERISNLDSEISGHEREKTSLQVELDKLNLFVSKQQEEASVLLKENQNLHHQLDSELKRADKAEADSNQLRDVVLRLKSEMESALLQYRFSKGRISELEAEISCTKEEFKNINLEMSLRSSKLNMAEDHCLLVQEENKSLQYELDKFMKKATLYEEEINMREEELKKLEQSIEFERQHNVQAEITENSLRTQLHKLEQRVEMQEEEIAIREQELNELKQHVEDGQKQRLQSEKVHQALVELHSQSQEKMRCLILEIQHGAEKLRKTELRKAGLEEEIMRLRDENKCLSEQNFSSVSKIICLQDEIILLKPLKNKIQDEARFNAEEKIFLQRELSSYKRKSNDLEQGHHKLMDKLRRMELREAVFEEEMRRLHDENIGLYEKFFALSSEIVNLQDEILCLRESKYKLEDDLQFHVDEKKGLRQEIFSLENEKIVLEERHHELTEHIEEVNYNVISLQAVVKDLHDGNKELRDTCKKHEEEKAGHLKQFMLMRIVADKNAQLDNFFSNPSAELKSLFEKINGLEEYCKSIYSNVHSHISSEPVLVSQIEAVTQNTAKLSEKHSVLEDSISDLNVVFDVLSGKVKALEEPCQSPYCQKFHLITDNNNLVSQVERVGLHLQSLENRFVILEGKQVNIEEKDLSLCHIQKFHGKEEHHDDHICFFRNQLSVLSNQIHLLKKENQVTKEELEEEHLRTVEREIGNFIMKQFLVDLNETNLFLSKECRKYIEKLELAENFILELKQEWASQEMKLVTISDSKEKLLEGIRVMMKTCDNKKACDISNDGDDDILQNILHKISELQGAILAAKGDIHQLLLEKTLSFRLLEQLARISADLRAPKKILERGYVLRNQEFFSLHKRNCELTEINGPSWKDINVGKQCQELLTLELERISGRLLDLQEASHASQTEISMLLEENDFSTKKLHVRRDQNDALDEENEAILEESRTQEHPSLIFRSCHTDKSSDIEWLIRDVNHLYRLTNDLGQEIGVINKSIRAIEADYMHVKNEYRTHTAPLENKTRRARNASGILDMEAETRKKQLEQRDMEIINTGKNFLEIQNPESLSSPEGSILTMVLGEELEKNKFCSLLEEENSCKDHELGCLQESNKLLEVEVHKLHKLAEELATKEKNLISELQISNDECGSYKAEATKLRHDLYVSSLMELIFKEKFFELMQIREADIVQLNIPVEEIVQEDLKEKFDVLGRENKGLKAELNAFAPLVVSLEKEITSLEEHILSSTNLHILNSKRKQGNILAALHHTKCSQARGKYQSPRASGGILELKRLRAKVKVLQKELTDADGTNETKKNKTFKLTGKQKKKDIIMDLRKSDSSGKDVKLLEDGVFSRVKHEQIMKDIELDHVLSGSQRESDFNVETDDQTLVVWEPATWNNIKEIRHMEDTERSSNPSSELVLEKELRVDNLILPSKYNESLQEWIDRVRGSLSADSQRLLALEKSLEELKMKIKTPEIKRQPSASEHNTVKLLLKEAEEALIKLTDFNFKLTKVAETFSLSSDGHKIRRKVLERVQRGAEKIDGVELKLQKVHSILLKLQDEKLEIKAAKLLEKRSRLPLKDLIYGKRSDPKQMKRRFCACMRFKTKEN